MLSECTIYNTNQPLHEQMVPDEQEMLKGPFSGGETYKSGYIKFKPIDIGGTAYTISMELQSRLNFSKKSKKKLVDECIFTIKNNTTQANVAEDILGNEGIERVVKDIYKKNVKENKTNE